MIDRSGAIRYRGRIDDQYEPGLSRSAARQHDLRDAIDQLLAGKGCQPGSNQGGGLLDCAAANGDTQVRCHVL